MTSPPLDQGPPPRVALPLAWMPWQSQILLPYLLPPELPETQLRELSDYAVGFASRGGHDVLGCLRVMVMAVHRGWRGFDPANGRVADADHVRVACGRDYRDAAPVTGTIYAGGGVETLGARVRVEAVGASAQQERGFSQPTLRQVLG